MNRFRSISTLLWLVGLTAATDVLTDQLKQLKDTCNKELFDPDSGLVNALSFVF